MSTSSLSVAVAPPVEANCTEKPASPSWLTAKVFTGSIL